MEIRPSTESDRKDIIPIHRQAFGEKQGPEITELVEDLFDDPTAQPMLSLVAVENDKLIGHILFTHVVLRQATETVSAQLLAPLAVLPEAHKQGIGSQLINEGLRQLKSLGVELVFVLGHPGYYPRCGFVPAGALGLEAPYPIPEKDAGAWMVQELNGKALGRIKGVVQCAETLSQPRYWRE